MLKKNTVLYNFFVLLLVSAVISVTGCKKDDNGPTGSESSITGAGKITLNGGGFSNKEYTLLAAVGLYSTVNNYTGVTMTGQQAYSILVVAGVPGNATGTFNWETQNGAVVSLQKGSLSFISGTNGQTKITKFESVSGKIEGNYSGYVYYVISTTLDSIYVSGSFSATRLSDVVTKK